MCLSLSQVTLLGQAAWLRKSFRYLLLHVKKLLTLDKLLGSQHQKAPVPDLSFLHTHPENRHHWPVWQSSEGRGQGESSWWFLSVRCTCWIFRNLQGCCDVALTAPDKGVLATSGRMQASHPSACRAGSQHCRVPSWASALLLLSL